MNTSSDARVVLASASKVRARLLKDAGLTFDVRPVRVDETSIRESLVGEGATPREIAEALGELKAMRAATQSREFVIAADQVLAFNGEVLGKAETLDQARDQLCRLRGQSHQLVTAACVARNGSVIWRYIDTATLWVRAFSDAFLDRYLECNRDAVLRSVGGYELEGEGAQLFSRIDGNYFTILGLPLLPLLDVLRENGVLAK